MHKRTYSWHTLSGLLFILFLTVACTVPEPQGQAHVPAQADAQPTDITLAQANAVIAAAHQKALEQGTLMNIAVVDRSGDLKAFVRMDDAFVGSIDIAIKKAHTSAIFPFPTGVLGELSQPGQPLYQIEVSNDGLISFPGGYPITDAHGNQIGAIGVSGGTVEEDHDVAIVGADAVLADELLALEADDATGLGQALMVIDAAEQKAIDIGVPMDIAVVDASANLKAFKRMDNAFLGSIDIAIKKARTSALFPFDSGFLGEISQPGQPVYQIEHSNGGLISFPGGVPLVDSEGTHVGGIGVSTGTVEEDHEVAIAGAEVYATQVAAGQPVNITLDQAMAVVAAAQDASIALDTLMNIAVVDSGGNLIAFARMDDSFLGSIDIAIKKAQTAVWFTFPTGVLGEISQPGQPVWQIEYSNGGLITFPGGLPILDADGNMIGAVGISGSTVEDDHEVAMAGAEAVLADELYTMAADGDSELDMAFTAIYAAQDKAVEIDVPMDIAVVDDGGNLKAFTRMDGAFVGSIDIAIMKAKTSAIFPFATGELGELSQPGQPLYKIELSNDGLITFPGGVPLMTSGGEPFGGIGVSTGTVEQDHEVAIAGVEALAE